MAKKNKVATNKKIKKEKAKDASSKSEKSVNDKDLYAKQKQELEEFLRSLNSDITAVAYGC